MNRETHGSKALAVLALLAAGVSAGCSSKPNDAQLITSIQSQMFADAQLKGASIDVASSSGQVTLKGTVPSDAARYEAYKIATQTPGVTKVDDQMSVAPLTAQAAPAAPVELPAPAEHASVTPHPASRHHVTQKTKGVSHAAHEKKQEVAMNTPPPPAVQTPTPAATPAAAQAPIPADTPASAPAPAVAAVPAPPPPPEPTPVEVPAGTTVSIRMIDGIDSSVNKAGEVFHASLDAPIVVGNDVIVPKGADVYVRLTSASSAGKISGQSELRLELVKLELQGHSYPLVSTTYSETGKSRGKDTAEKVGGGAVLGAIIGAIAGGGKGAAIGAAAGGGAGTVYQGATQGQQVKVPAETKLDFQLDQPVTIKVMPHAAS